MRQIIREKSQAPLAPPSGPIAICRNTSLPVRNNQSEPGGVSRQCQLCSCTHWSRPSLDSAPSNQTHFLCTKQTFY